MHTYNLEKLRVLVVDDSQYMIKIIRVLLDAMGIRDVYGIDCPTKVFTAIKDWQPDLIISDHIMEPMTGLQMIQHLRADESNPQRFIPIILLTGYAKAEVVKEARFNAGADAVLVKPVSAQRLYDCIVSVYESDRTFIETKHYFGPDRRVKDRPFEGSERRGDADPGQDRDKAGSDNDLELVLIDDDEDDADVKKIAVTRGRT